jgi:hypothetical protein
MRSVSASGAEKRHFFERARSEGMKNGMIGLLACLLTTWAVAGDSALYKDKVLTISDAIVMEGETPRYYRDVRLEIDANGNFTVADAVEKTLAYVEELAVGVFSSDPVEVELNVVGYLANPCIELNTAVSRKGNTFFVVVGENPLHTLVACAQVIVPFDIRLPLDVKGLPAGVYLVVVNDKTIEFNLE